MSATHRVPHTKEQVTIAQRIVVAPWWGSPRRASRDRHRGDVHLARQALIGTRQPFERLNLCGQYMGPMHDGHGVEKVVLSCLFCRCSRISPSRIRHLEADRAPFRRSVAISRDLSLPVAPPAREKWMDYRTMGGKGRAAPPALLQPDTRRTTGTPRKTAKLERLRRADSPRHGTRTWLIGTRWCGAAWRSWA